MKYIVYLTTNKKNNKIYIGVHETENPGVFDGYIGCGANINKPSSYNKGKTLLHAAILKYGTSAFYRHTLKVFDNLEDALDLESLLVTEEFVSRTDTYNTDSINTKNFRISSRGYVIQYNKNGDFLNEFTSASEASIKLDIDRQAIINAIFDRTLCNGCYFLKADEDIQQLLKDKYNTIKINKTKVYRYTIDGKFDKEFESKQAVVDTGLNRNKLNSAIKSGKVYEGFRWSLIKSEVITEYTPPKAVKVAQYDLNHNLIKVWDTVSECKKEFPSCQKVCRKERRSTNGFIFEYIS